MSQQIPPANRSAGQAAAVLDTFAPEAAPTTSVSGSKPAGPWGARRPVLMFHVKQTVRRSERTTAVTSHDLGAMRGSAVACWSATYLQDLPPCLLDLPLTCWSGGALPGSASFDCRPGSPSGRSWSPGGRPGREPGVGPGWEPGLAPVAPPGRWRTCLRPLDWRRGHANSPPGPLTTLALAFGPGHTARAAIRQARPTPGNSSPESGPLRRHRSTGSGSGTFPRRPRSSRP